MPTLYLVVDEVVVVRAHRIRLTVWRGIDAPPVVLLSQVPGDVPPDQLSSALANLVLRSFLGYSIMVPTFFELSRWEGKARAFRVRFETIGCQLRPILVNPQRSRINPQALERLLGVKLDNPNQGAA